MWALLALSSAAYIRLSLGDLSDDDDSVVLLQSIAQLGKHQDSIAEQTKTSPLAGCRGFECIEQYVKLPDESYHWEDTGVRLRGVGSDFDEVTTPAVQWTGYVLNMTSHTWPNRVSNPVWWHTLVVIDPSNREMSDVATLVMDFGIEDGNQSFSLVVNRLWPGAEPGKIVSFTKENLMDGLTDLTRAVQKAVYLATKTKAMTASLLDCPNAYEVFANDEFKVHRSADVLKGYTYGDFLEHPSEPERIMELPVAKSVVRAMDTITAFTNGSISRFGVTGYSKLGTATYIAGALDDRVQVIVPIAIYLNFANVMGKKPELSPEEFVEGLETARYEFHTKGDTAYEAYALAFFHAAAQTPEFKKLHEIIDPSAWLSKLTKPKLCIMSGTDMVLGRNVLDEPELLQPSMPGLTRFLEIPNSAHFNSLVHSLPTSSAFLRGFLLGMSPPEISYVFNRTSRAISVQQVSHHSPVEVLMWRREIVLWTQSPLRESSPGSGTWIAVDDRQLDSSESDAGMFVMLRYDWPEPGFQFRISSPVMSYTPASLFDN
jgi:PhoPQ-activated pathogenicity-related protein